MNESEIPEEEPEEKYVRKNIMKLEDGSFLVIEDRPHTPKELDEIADAYLKSHVRAINPETGKRNGLNNMLFEEHLKYRKRREIYTQNGVADPSVTEFIVEKWRNNSRGRNRNPLQDE